ncbi:uncharacterized protein LOC125474407 [Pyrus x bretschneideri]|uniref:uncharacterized protein LOC125474407 n=1 Tax=Pyrus x bretschneideri TaxID=225117 RepID=UPI002031003D|nr:uncharacterized protein LOC125474407 [Pyrus x bretschneideri]
MTLQLTSLVVGLLFVMHALGQSSTAHAHQGKGDISVTGKHAVLPDQKEPNVDGISIAGSRMIWLGGRKMVAHKVLRKLEPTRPAGQLNEEASTTFKNSGKDNSKASSNSHGKPQNKLNQDDMKTLELTALKSTSAGSLEIPRDLKPNHSQNFKTKRPTTKAPKITTYDEKDDHKLTDEARRLLKATREIVNLMHKDYHRMGSRKPPIHNFEPRA